MRKAVNFGRVSSVTPPSDRTQPAGDDRRGDHEETSEEGLWSCSSFIHSHKMGIINVELPSDR